MPKYVIKEEGLVRRFVEMLFTAILHGRDKEIQKAIQNDPQMQKYAKQLAALKQSIEKHVAENSDLFDPEVGKTLDKYM